MGEKALESGTLMLEGQAFEPSVDRRIAFLAKNPTLSMLFPELSCFDNLCFTLDHRMPEVWYSRQTREGIKRQYEEKAKRALPWQDVKGLTRKQRYELIYQRIMLQNPKVLFCEQPFREADLETRIRIWELLDELMKKGIAVVVLAVNLSDSLALANRLIRIKQNGEQEVFEREQFKEMPFDAPWINLYQGE